MSYPHTRLFIAGTWQDAADGKTIAVHNPATGKEIGRVAHASKADLDRALEAAQKGFEAWRDIPAVDRAKTMRRAAALIRERAESIAAIMVQEQGKPLAEAKVETMSAAEIIEWFADESQRVYGRIVPSRNLKAQQLVIKDPVGPVAAFTPWNFPVNQIVRKIGAALASGCSFLVKAPEETPASPAALKRCGAALLARSPGLLSRRVTPVEVAHSRTSRSPGLASRNPSRPLQIVVPRTSDESCTQEAKRESCQVGRGLVARGFAPRVPRAGAGGCVVLVRRRTAMKRSVRPKQMFQPVSKSHQFRFLLSDFSSFSKC